MKFLISLFTILFLSLSQLVFAQDDFATIKIQADEIPFSINIDGEPYDNLKANKSLILSVAFGEKKRIVLETAQGDKYLKEIKVTAQDKGKVFLVKFPAAAASSTTNVTSTTANNTVTTKEKAPQQTATITPTKKAKQAEVKKEPAEKVAMTGVGGSLDDEKPIAENGSANVALVAEASNRLKESSLLFKDAMERLSEGKINVDEKELTTTYTAVSTALNEFKSVTKTSTKSAKPVAGKTKPGLLKLSDTAGLTKTLHSYEAIKEGRKPASRSLVIAIKSNRVNDLKFWINKRNADTLIDEMPMLIYALDKRCNADVVKYILDRSGAKEEMVNYNKYSFKAPYNWVYLFPLTKACINGDTSVINALIDAKARFYPEGMDENKTREHVKFLWKQFGSNKNVRAVVKRRMTDFPDPLEAALNAFAKYKNNMVLVEGGSFYMGCKGDPYDCGPAWPLIEVTVPSFYISKYEMTQDFYQTVMDYNPSSVQDCPDCPVENVSYVDVQEFLERLSNITGKKFRLPSEKEWEYAAKGGKKSSSYKYAGSNNLDSSGWNKLNCTSLQPVGKKIPNELGLYDMSGNVFELCSNLYSKNLEIYKNSPEGEKTGVERIVRGGSFRTGDFYAEPVRRTKTPEEMKSREIGFRLVMEP